MPNHKPKTVKTMPSPILPVFSPFPVSFVRGEGVYLYDTSGKRYLDFGSGVAVSALGHSHPSVIRAITEQVNRVIHVSNWYQIPEQYEAAETLIANTFADYVFFANSGTETIDGAIKLVRQYQIYHKRPERYRIITVKGSFHGRTFAAMSACGKNTFAPDLPGFDSVPFGDWDALESAITPHTAGILIEPILGEGGILPVPLTQLRRLRDLCDQHDLVLCFDEIQTGVGRTGHLYAYEAAGIAPDVLTTAKGLGAGFPVGAILANKKVGGCMQSGMHGSTFGGNPLACKVVSAVLAEITQPPFLDHVRTMGQWLWEELETLRKTYPHVFSQVRGAGLMQGLVCSETMDNRSVAMSLMQKGLLVIPAGQNTIRLMPPLIVTKNQIDEAVAILRDFCKDPSFSFHHLNP
jgi:acetylornithine/N-succinyldiaminopimelate aminotransferase